MKLRWWLRVIDITVVWWWCHRNSRHRRLTIGWWYWRCWGRWRFLIVFWTWWIHTSTTCDVSCTKNLDGIYFRTTNGEMGCWCSVLTSILYETGSCRLYLWKKTMYKYPRPHVTCITALKFTTTRRPIQIKINKFTRRKILNRVFSSSFFSPFSLWLMA